MCLQVSMTGIDLFAAKIRVAELCLDRCQVLQPPLPPREPRALLRQDLRRLTNVKYSDIAIVNVINVQPMPQRNLAQHDP